MKGKGFYAFFTDIDVDIPLAFCHHLRMPSNDDMISIRLPSDLKRGLEEKFPDVRDRNNLIRALIQKYIHGDIHITKYEIKIANT